MKFVFDIATSPTLHAIVAVAIINSSLMFLATIAVTIRNPTVIIFWETILLLIILIVLVVPPPVNSAAPVRQMATTLGTASIVKSRNN